MRITFFGGAGGVTGANHLLEIRKTKLIVDCGLFQSGQFVDELNKQNFAYDPASLNYALITHAHLDHVGRLPKLYKEGFRGKILATPPTIDITRLILEDSCRILEYESSKNKNEKPFTCMPEVEKVMKLFEPVHYRKPYPLSSTAIATFYDAGHILGSSMIEIKDKKEKKTIIFSGDFGNIDKPILNDPTQIEEADFVVVESAYGNRIHESDRSKKFLLGKLFIETVKKKGVLMIPAFSIERTQELLYYFNSLVEKHGFKPIPTFLDSPLAIKITQVFKKYPEYYDSEAYCLVNEGDDFLQFPGLKLTETTQESKNIFRVVGPKIIIAGSGMMHAGRILNHMINYLPGKNNTLLIVGFQVRGSIGRKLLDGATSVRIHGEEIPVRARITAIGAMSAHGDSNMLLRWVKNIKGVKRVFTVQGDPEAANYLANRINKNTKAKAMAPGLGYSEELV
ncbi:MAG TPA: MBL fold metallo-hydrolase [Patescibacteria group bacterium]|nr:MBL fold metallo-hydrolase [Patescibacteria group bacterium]